MRKTRFCCKYELKDTTAVEDSTLATAYNQSFANITGIKEKIPFPDYATLEQDYFLLDGSFPEFPDVPDHIIYFSSVMTDADGMYEGYNPLIHIMFDENHTSYGLTFYFVGDHPLEMEIRWYGLDGSYLDGKKFEVTGNQFFAWNQVENYGRLEVEFIKAKPYRYVKFYYIEYGTDLTFGGDGYAIKDASLTEEADPVSDKIPINKLKYKVIDETEDFNLGNQAGMHKVLQAGQQMLAYETVNGEKILLGKFFLDSSSTTQNVTTMNCVDYKGLLDKSSFRGGRVYNGDPAGSVIDEIMGASGIVEYVVDEEIRNVPLYGWLKIQTCRKALREVLFACGAVIDSSRSRGHTIFRPSRVVKSSIRRNRKFSTTINTEDYISDVSVKISRYSPSEQISEIIRGSYEPGTYTIDLTSPATEMTINTGAIVEQTDNFITFQVEETADVIISGKKYRKEDLTVTSSVEKVAAGQIRKNKSFSCTVLSAAGAGEVAKRLLDYYQLRLNLKIKALNEGDCTTDWEEVFNTRSIYGNYVAGIEKMTTDLTGGFLSTIEMRGYYKLLADYDYTNELFTGDEIGDL